MAVEIYEGEYLGLLAERDTLRARVAELEAELSQSKITAAALEDLNNTLMSDTLAGRRLAELESALAKSASREAALVEKLRIAEEALQYVSMEHLTPHGAGVARAALAKIKEAS